MLRIRSNVVILGILHHVRHLSLRDATVGVIDEQILAVVLIAIYVEDAAPGAFRQKADAIGEDRGGRRRSNGLLGQIWPRMTFVTREVGWPSWSPTRRVSSGGWLVRLRPSCFPVPSAPAATEPTRTFERGQPDVLKRKPGLRSGDTRPPRRRSIYGTIPPRTIRG